jgi:hypothetical protein
MGRLDLALAVQLQLASYSPASACERNAFHVMYFAQHEHRNTQLSTTEQH